MKWIFVLFLLLVWGCSSPMQSCGEEESCLPVCEGDILVSYDCVDSFCTEVSREDCLTYSECVNKTWLAVYGCRHDECVQIKEHDCNYYEWKGGEGMECVPFERGGDTCEEKWYLNSSYEIIKEKLE